MQRVDLKKKNGTTYLFISHDMAAVKAVCDRIMVMYLGNILEILPQARMCLFDHGAHPALASNGLAAADAVRDFFS